MAQSDPNAPGASNAPDISGAANPQAKFLTGALMKHIAVMAMASSVGLMVVFLVDFVDMVFIAMLGKAELAAAIGYAGAILFFTGSFGIGVAIAAGALVARALGQGDIALARQRGTNALTIGFTLGALFAATVWFNIDTLVGLLGATGDTRILAVDFMQIILPSLPILLFGIVCSAILRAHGDARRSMLAMIAGGLVNAVLDPILIFGFGLELTGAAMASIAARITLATLTFGWIRKYHQGLARFHPGPVLRDFGPVMGIALPAILTQLATPVGQAWVTRAMASYGEDAVAGMAIVGRLTPVSFGILFALSGAVGPIIGQNAGAGQAGRVRQTFRDALIFTGVVSVTVATILFGLRGGLEWLFQLEGEARQLVFLFAGPLALLWFFNGVIFVSNAAFNNLGRPFLSTLVNWGRHTLGTIPFVVLGGWLWHAPGVLIGQAAGGVVFGLLAWALARRVMADRGGAKQPGPQDAFARQGRLLALFTLRR
ncbi:MAG: MATE family efflux transporter [Rhodobacterales bacterium]|nr:MAG: MATE family efflux transporter [Rhodobacterales bacterium]